MYTYRRVLLHAGPHPDLTVGSCGKMLLKAICFVTGARVDLENRVANGMTYGALPRCPVCCGGKLHTRANGRTVFCKGCVSTLKSFQVPNYSFVLWS